MGRHIVLVCLALCGLPDASWATSKNGSPHDVVAAIYARETIEEAKPSRGGTAFTASSVRTRYFSARFNRLLAWGDRQAEREQGVGPLEFDPVISGQDGKLTKIEIKLDSETPDSAVVSAHFLNFGEPTVVTYDLVRENGGWAVDDIKGRIEKDNWSVRDMIEEARRKR